MSVDYQAYEIEKKLLQHDAVTQSTIETSQEIWPHQNLKPNIWL